MDFKKSFLLIVLFSFTTISCGSSEPQLHVPGESNRVEDIYNSVVALVKIENNSFRSPFCTASFISPTLLATAAHCVVHEDVVMVGPGTALAVPSGITPVGEEIQFVTLRQYNDWINVANDTRHNNPEYTTSTVVEVDTEDGHDVALLEINDGEESSRNWLKIRNLVREPLQPGEVAYSIGMPVGQIWILTDGIISRIQIRQNGSVDILHQVRTGPGSSGAPIMDYLGRIIGIHSAGWSGRRSGTVVGEAKPISYIQTLISILNAQRNANRVPAMSLPYPMCIMEDNV